MKQLVFLLAVMSFCCSFSATARHKKMNKKPVVIENEAAETKSIGPIFKFKGSESFNFRKVKRNAVVAHTFSYTNIGDKPLFIDNVTATCSCISVKWDIDPVLPGKKGNIYVTFNSREVKGEFYKELHILSNATLPKFESYQTLFINGEVEPISFMQHDHMVAGW